MIELHLKIAAEAALGRIVSFMDEYKSPFWRFQYTGERSYLGRVNGNQFFIFKKCDNRNAIPTLDGIVTEADTGCVIKADFRSNSFHKMFMFAWFGFVIFSLVVGILLFLKGYWMSTFEPGVFMTILVPFIMLVFGIILFYSMMQFRKKHEQLLIRAFCELFEDVRQKADWGQDCNNAEM